ncbi:hypothetical protein TNCV_1452161 [Trichonephila clavipes]|nr:hypothetical protein TNCV_1452161 [Trichonephila clavipes]
MVIETPTRLAVLDTDVPARDAYFLIKVLYSKGDQTHKTLASFPCIGRRNPKEAIQLWNLSFQIYNDSPKGDQYHAIRLCGSSVTESVSPPAKLGFGPQAGSYKGYILGVSQAEGPLESWSLPLGAGVSSHNGIQGRGSLVVKVTDSWLWCVMSSSLVPLKTHRAEETGSLTLHTSKIRDTLDTSPSCSEVNHLLPKKQQAVTEDAQISANSSQTLQ